MYCVTQIFTQTLEVKQSKFIAFLVPYSLYESKLYELQALHPKARHFVVAFRYLNEFHQIVEHSSDDGEPKGTSGKPSLMVLQGADIINSAVVVVRYFGGTKLGTGGLVRAYSDAVNLVISEAELLEYTYEISKKISFEYATIRLVEYECMACGISVIDKSFELDTIYTIRASEQNMQIFLEKMERQIKIVE